jgi:hypothetical protein
VGRSVLRGAVEKVDIVNAIDSGDSGLEGSLALIGCPSKSPEEAFEVAAFRHMGEENSVLRSTFEWWKAR